MFSITRRVLKDTATPEMYRECCYQGPSDWTTSTSTSFEFETSDVSRVLALHVGV